MIGREVVRGGRILGIFQQNLLMYWGRVVRESQDDLKTFGLSN